MSSRYAVHLDCVRNYIRGAVDSRSADIFEKIRSQRSLEIGGRFNCLSISPKLLHQTEQT